LKRGVIGLMAVVALLGLGSCADETPVEPLFQLGPGPQPFPAPSPPTPAAPSGPADSLLEANRALWVSLGVDSYRYRFRWLCYCTTDYVQVVDITVRDGTIVSVVEASSGRPVTAQQAAYYRTIDDLFVLLRDAIDQPAHSIHTVYEANLGFPIETDIDYVANMADDELSFQVYGLTPLTRQ